MGYLPGRRPTRRSSSWPAGGNCSSFGAGLAVHHHLHPDADRRDQDAEVQLPVQHSEHGPHARQALGDESDDPDHQGGPGALSGPGGSEEAGGQST